MKHSNNIPERLLAFRKKFYRQELIHGLLLSTFSVLIVLLIFSALAYFIFLPTTARALMFYGAVIFSLFILSKEALLPFLKMLNLLPGISNKEAAKIIGNHFRDQVDDKLLNAVHLIETDPDNTLAAASIQQKTDGFSGVNFYLAIPKERVKRAIRLLLVPLSFAIGILVFNPDLIRMGGERIINHEVNYGPSNPYQIHLPKKLVAVAGEPYNLEIEFIGDEIPLTAELISQGRTIQMSKKGQGKFSYSYSALNSNTNFQIKTGIHFSQLHNIVVKHRPELSNLKISVKEPRYLGGKDYEKKGDGNLTVPEGSEINISFETTHSDSATIEFNGDTLRSKDVGNFSKSLLVKKSLAYSISLTNRDGLSSKTFKYRISSIADEFPKIALLDNPAKNSISWNQLATGNIVDDHGFTKLLLHVEGKDTSFSVAIPIEKNKLAQQFSQALDFKALGLSSGSKTSYYFEVFDNDEPNGFKSAKSDIKEFVAPGKQAIDSLLEENDQDLEKLLADAAKDAANIQEEFKKVNQMLLENQNLSWEDQQRVQNLLQQQKDLREKVNALQQKNQENQQQKTDLKGAEKILDKQKEIDELFKDLLDEETKKLFDELEKLMQQMQNKANPEMLEQLNFSNEKLENSLDRTLELFKQMKFEDQLKDAIDQLKELSEKEKDLAQQAESNQKKNLDEIRKQQDSVKKSFEDLKKKVDDLEKQNEELSNKRNFQKTEQEEKSIDKDLNDSQENLQKGKQKKAGKSQKNASEKMQEMANKLSKMKSSDDASEDLQTMRQLLENLMYLSTEQEQLLSEVKKLRPYDQKQDQMIKRQKSLLDDAKLIEDSLFALSKRQASLSSYINNEIKDMRFNQKKALRLLEERKGSIAAVNQQLVMTSANNLALILDESIQNTQSQMRSKKQGGGSCSKPGGSKSGQKKGMQSLKDMLNKQIQQMKKEMKKKGNSPGNTGQKGNKGQAKTFGKMAAEQGVMSEQLKKLQQQLQKEGKTGLGDGKNLEKILDETTKELLNQKITPETIKRQQAILTKLLEAEKSINEREYEEKRSSKTGNISFNRNPSEFLEYKKTKKEEEDLLKIMLPSLNLFYQKKVNEYFNTFDK